MLDFRRNVASQAAERSLTSWEKISWCLTIGLTAAVLARLWLNGLIRAYRLLFLYLSADFLSSVGGLAIGYNTKYYPYFYFSAQTVKVVLAAAVLVEIYSLALESHPALARFGRSAVGYILGIAGAAPLIALWVDRSTSAGGTRPFLRAFFLFEQTIDATMAIFLIVISIFLTWFPVRLRHNVAVYIGGFIVWSLSRSAYIFVFKQWFRDERMRQVSNTVQMCVGFLCLLFWLIGLEREGEANTTVVGHLWNRAEAERLTGQLDAINRSLERLRRK